MNALPKALDLYHGLRAVCAYRIAFNTMYLANIPTLDPSTRITLFDIVGNKFSQRSFLDNLLTRDPYTLAQGIQWDEWDPANANNKLTWKRSNGAAEVIGTYSGQRTALIGRYTITIKDRNVSQRIMRNDGVKCSYVGMIWNPRFSNERRKAFATRSSPTWGAKLF